MAQDAKLTITADGVGALKIGGSLDDARAALGEPSEQQQIGGMVIDEGEDNLEFEDESESDESEDDGEIELEDQGAPQVSEAFLSIEWASLGLSAFASLDGTIRSVKVAYRNLFGEQMASFAGKTDRGIGAGATEAEIEAAYGAAPEKRGNKGENLTYPGLQFSLNEGTLYEISIDPERQPVAREALPPAKPQTETGRRALAQIAELERRIAELGRDDVRVVFTPAEAAWVDNVEHKFGHRLPPSYRELVLSRGTLHVEVEGRNTFWMIPVADLGGPEPTWWDGQGENDEVDDAIARSLFFAYQSDDAVEDFFAFDPATVDDDGEMGVSRYHHDDSYTGGGGASFDEYLAGEIESLFKYYLA